MRQLLTFLLAATLLAGCQTADDTLATGSAPIAISGSAASAIAGDMASRLAEQIGQAGSTTIKMDKGTSEFAVALEAALKGWGYAIVTDGKVGKGVKPVELSYSVDSVGGQILAQLSTPSIALGRAYTATPGGATPASPLSIMQRN
ncbi:conjugal transfer protein TrbH [Mesorhizobium sp. SP-1A]|uniref:conjugal transfer protein TrbH n=1 Tax=Mesorhizobium sp. SP-1A TaxID=3077840 RepID=UPI0028F70DDF|nr:conjugal transfer protein TrbH [Mesorhizobium sp. SP-1A]